MTGLTERIREMELGFVRKSLLDNDPNYGLFVMLIEDINLATDELFARDIQGAENTFELDVDFFQRNYFFRMSDEISRVGIKKMDVEVRQECIDGLAEMFMFDSEEEGAEIRGDTDSFFNKIFWISSIPLAILATIWLGYIAINPVEYETRHGFAKETALYRTHKQRQIPQVQLKLKKADENYKREKSKV